MKKIILCTLVILALFFIISCKKTENIDENKEIIMEDLYFFRTYSGGIFNTASFSDNGPIKINPVSKTASYVCADPLCDHSQDSGCPFYSTGNYYVTGNYIFYTREYGVDSVTGEPFGTSDFCVYDMINGTVRKLDEYLFERAQIIGGINNYLYYYLNNYNEKDGSVYYALYRADADTGKVVKIGEESFGFESKSEYNSWAIPKVYAIADNKIYWYTNGELTDGIRPEIRYTTDLDGKNKEMLEVKKDLYSRMGVGATSSCYSNGYFYHAVVEMTQDELDRDAVGQVLYRIPLDGSAKNERIAENIIDFAICGDKIYYTAKLEEEPEIIEYDEGQYYYDRNGGKVYVMNLDGSDKSLVCETGYNLDSSVFGDTTGFLEVKTIEGVDYIIFLCKDFEAEKKPYDPMSIDYPDTLIINASTGEYTVVSVPE